VPGDATAGSSGWRRHLAGSAAEGVPMSAWHSAAAGG